MSFDASAPVCCKLSDFGTSRTIGSGDSARTFTKGVGTPVYCAPEILDGKKYSFSADVYSYALLLWHLFTEVVPYSEVESNYGLLTPFTFFLPMSADNFKRIPAVLKLVMDGKRPKLLDTIPAPMHAIIENSWAADPDRRMEFSAILTEIERMMQESGDLPAASSGMLAGSRTHSTKGKTKSTH